MKKKAPASTSSQSNHFGSNKSHSNKKRSVFNNSHLSTPNEPNDEFSSRKIDDFFKITSIHKSTLSELVKSNLTTPSPLYNKNKTLSSKYYPFIKHKHRSTNIKKSNINGATQEHYNYKQIDTSIYNFFSENEVNIIAQSFKDKVIKELKIVYEHLSNNKTFPFFNYNNLHYDRFIHSFLNNILIKYLLITYDNLIYIPNSIFEANQIDNNKHLLKFIGGYNETKKIKLLYEPINGDESKSFFPNLTHQIEQYIRKFKSNLKKKNKLQNALVLYKPGDDYIQSVNTIEIICNDLGYQIIKLDELESQKYNKLNKVEEATKSKRLWSIDEDILNQFNIIEYMCKNKDIKWSTFIRKLNINFNNNLNDNNNVIDINTQRNLNYLNSQSSIISEGSNYNNNSIEYKSFDMLQKNIFNIAKTKKTLILIVDTFTPNDENNKLYLSNIIAKIPKTKCPIIILTNNLSIFHTISPPVNICNFSFHKIINEGYNNNSLIYLISLLLYLHIFIKPSSSNDIDVILKDIEKINEDLKLKMYLDKLYNSIVEMCFTLCLKNEFVLDKILWELSFAIRKISNIPSLDERIQNIKKIILNDSIYEDIFDNCYLDINNELQQLCLNYNEMSYFDYEKGKIKQIANRRFNYLIKFKQKNIEHVNNERYMLDPASYYHPEEESTYILKDIQYKQRLIEMQRFYHMFLSNNELISTHFIYEYNYLLLHMLYSLPYDDIMSIFHIRKTRRSQQSNNDSDIHNKINTVHKLFKHSSCEFFNIFLHAFNNDKIYININSNNKQCYINLTYALNFYNYNVLLEKIKQNILLYSDTYIRNNNIRDRDIESENEESLIAEEEIEEFE